MKLKGIDLESIMDTLISEKSTRNNNMEKRAIMMFTYLGVGRGGETKFLRYDDSMWDHLLECPEFFWRQRKTLEATEQFHGR